MTKVSRAQFVFTSDTSIRHEPTGATFSTYRYVDPNDTPSSMFENPGLAGERLENGDEYAIHDIRALAAKMLRERALSERRNPEKS